MNIAILVTCHNRCDTTLAFLRSLVTAIQEYKNSTVQRRPSAISLRSIATSNLQPIFHLFLVDDGSTDGTSEAVQEWYNSTLFHSSLFTLHLIHANGSLYWARGMSLAWRTALEYETHRRSTSNLQPQPLFSHFLWLNDDAMLRPDAFIKIFDTAKSHPELTVVNGSMVNKAGKVTYGLGIAIGLAGNCVLVPRDVYEKVGMICDKYSHAWADRDYGMHVEKAGCKMVSCGIVGETEWHPHRPSLAGLSLRERIAMLSNPKGWNLHDLWLFRIRNWNIFCAIFSCLHMTLRVLIGDRK